MSDTPGDKYSIQELFTFYDLNPEIRDVLVEGQTDAAFYGWYLGELQLDAEVYPIDARVHFASDDPVQATGAGGARERCQILAQAADTNLTENQKSLTIIIDADADRALGFTTADDSCLNMTDFPALESYAFLPHPLERFLRLFCRKSESVSAQEVISSLSESLANAHSARVVLSEYNIALIDNFLGKRPRKAAQSEVSVRSDDLIDRSIGSNRSAITEGLDALKLRASALAETMLQTQQHARGHDIAHFLKRFLRLSDEFGPPSAIEAGLRSNLTLDFLVGKPLFQWLAGRVAATA